MDCNNVLVLPYELNIEWFISILVVMFYSQRNREVILEASRRWNTKFPLLKLFHFILYYKYTKVSDDDYEYFSKMTLQNVLKEILSKESTGINWLNLTGSECIIKNKNLKNS